MTSALRWAAMKAILMFHNCEGQSHKTVSTDHNLWSERRAEADSNRGPSGYQPTRLTARPNRLNCVNLHTELYYIWLNLLTWCPFEWVASCLRRGTLVECRIRRLNRIAQANFTSNRWIFPKRQRLALFHPNTQFGTLHQRLSSSGLQNEVREDVTVLCRFPF